MKSKNKHLKFISLLQNKTRFFFFLPTNDHFVPCNCQNENPSKDFFLMNKEMVLANEEANQKKGNVHKFFGPIRFVHVKNHPEFHS